MRELVIGDKKSGRERIPLENSRNCLGFNSDCLGYPNGKNKQKDRHLQRFS